MFSHYLCTYGQACVQSVQRKSWPLINNGRATYFVLSHVHHTGLILASHNTISGSAFYCNQALANIGHKKVTEELQQKFVSY